MIKLIKTIQEEIDRFNSQKKYLETCEYCSHQFIYTEDEIRDNILKCPYCGHTQKVYYKKVYNPILKFVQNSLYEDDYFKV